MKFRNWFRVLHIAISNYAVVPNFQAMETQAEKAGAEKLQPMGLRPGRASFVGFENCHGVSVVIFRMRAYPKLWGGRA